MSNAARTVGFIINAQVHGANGVLHLIGHLTHMHGLVNNTNLALGRMRTALAGIGAVWAGSKILGGMKDMVDHGAKLVDLQNQMVAAGWKRKDVEEATAKAYETSAKYQSMGIIETLKMTKELAPVLGDRHHAVELTDQMAKFYVSMQGALGADKAGSFTHEVANAIRAGEISGNALQPEVFGRFMDSMARSLKAFSGTVSPSDYFMALKYAGPAGVNWSPDFIAKYLPTLMQEMGASSVGTASMTLYQTLIGGRMKLRAINAFDQLGMIDHSKLNPADLTQEGNIKRLSPGALEGSRLAMENPYDWAWQVLVPRLLKNGVVSQAGIDEIIKGNIKTGEGENARKSISEHLAMLFVDRTGQRLIDTLVLQRRKLDRDAGLIPEAMGLDEGSKFFTEKQYAMKMAAFHEQWENLLTALGSPHVATAVEWMTKFNNVLAGMTEWVNANPEMAVAGFQALGVLGASLVTLGVGAVLVSTLGLPAILLALGSALAWFGNKAGYFKELKALFADEKGEYFDKQGGYHARQPAGALSRAGRVAGNIGSVLWSAMSNGLQAMGTVLQRAVPLILSKIGSLFVSSIASGVGLVVWAAKMAAKFISAIATIPSMVYGAITEMAAAIGNAISSALAGIASSIGGLFTGSRTGGGKFNPRGAPSAGGVQKQNWAPSGGGQGLKVHTALNVDGRKLAENVTYHQVRSAQHVASAGTFDGRAAPLPGDLAFA